MPDRDPITTVCSVVFQGEIDEGQDLGTVKQRIAKLLKKGNIDQLFNGKPHVIRRNVDAETAEKVCKVFRRTGAVCYVHKSNAAPPPEPTDHEETKGEPVRLDRAEESYTERGAPQSATGNMISASEAGPEKAKNCQPMGRCLAPPADEKDGKAFDFKKAAAATLTVISSTISFAAAFILATFLPDLDKNIPFLPHRSIVTHSFFLPLFLYIFYLFINNVHILMAALGSGLALSLSFAFDLYPKAWGGYAQISIPFFGRSGALFSFLWIAFSMVVCILVSYKSIKGRRSLFLTVLAAGGGFYVAAGAEPGIMMEAALTLLVVVAPLSWKGYRKYRIKKLYENTPVIKIYPRSPHLHIRQ